MEFRNRPNSRRNQSPKQDELPSSNVMFSSVKCDVIFPFNAAQSYIRTCDLSSFYCSPSLPCPFALHYIAIFCCLAERKTASDAAIIKRAAPFATSLHNKHYSLINDANADDWFHASTY